MKAETVVEIPGGDHLSVFIQFGNDAAARTESATNDLDRRFRFQLHHRHRASNAVHMRDKHRQLCDLMIEQAIKSVAACPASRHVEPACSSRNFGFVLTFQCLAQCGFKPISFVRSQDDRIHPRECREFNGRVFIRMLVCFMEIQKLFRALC